VVTPANFWVFALVPLVSLPVFVRVGLYRAVIRYLGGKAFYTILLGVTVSSAILTAILLFAVPGVIPETSLGIYWVLALLYIGGSRLLIRDYYRENFRDRFNRQKVAIYGAGSAGVQLAMGLLSGREYRPVAFIDEKKELAGTVIHNMHVFLPEQMEEMVRNLGVKQVLLAIPSASRSRRREILHFLEPYPVHVRTVPGLADLVSGTAKVDDIQEVDVADLLGRDTVPPDVTLLSRCITGKSVMVTGAGGSIGAELCRQILQLKPSRLVLFELSEFGLYSIEQELDHLKASHDELKHVDIKVVLGSVTHKRRVEAVIRSFGVETIYHAAAYKHVPLVEHNPIEGVQNNLFGTWRTAEAAMAANVETFVLISTDKAVRPTNVMGATKRMAELVLQGLAQRESDTRFCMVRFGNVLGSSGSVVPLFREQIRKGGPVTVTHSEITRYFMTIPEAAQLVLQAGSMGEGGEVFVLDMGESVRIADLARRMIKLSGMEVLDDEHPHGDIEIVYTGLRPGEKLYEELLIGDNVSGTQHSRIMRCREVELPWSDLLTVLKAIDLACSQFDSEKVRQLLEGTVCGYVPQCGIVDPVWINMVAENKVKEIAAATNSNVKELNPRVVN
jgi:FlaA1/EpsC-like NDP-sugar epimerase